MNIRGLLLEMAVYNEEDVYNMTPIASVSSMETENLENEELRTYVSNRIRSIETNYNLSDGVIGVIIRHHCGHRKLKKAALLALPEVLNANLVTQPWKQKRKEGGRFIQGKDRRPTGMVSAPILIDGVKYLCNITTKINAQKVLSPYSITLKDGNGNIIESEKMEDSSNVPHSNSENPTDGDSHLDKVTTSHESNPSFQNTNLQHKNQTTKENNQENTNCNRNMNKNRVRLTESQLHKVIKESVRKILKEIYLHNNPGGWYDEDCSALPDEPDWESMSDEEFADYQKNQQMRDDWDEFEFVNDYNMRKRIKRNDFDEFHRLQSLKDVYNDIEGETSRNAYLSGANDDEMSKRHSRFNQYRKALR